MLLNSTVCIALLTGGLQISHPTSLDEQAATEWLEENGVSQPNRFQVLRAWENWTRWKAVTGSARKTYLALELQRLSPSQDFKIFPLESDRRVKALSAANKQRMIQQIAQRLPIDEQLLHSGLISQKVREISGNMTFNYLRVRLGRSANAVNPPLVSSHELAKYGLDFAPSFYSELVGRSPSVDFFVVASKLRPGQHSFEAQLPVETLLLKPEVAAAEGFVLPHFSDAKALIQFFKDWEPEQLERLLDANRMSLPSYVNTTNELISYLESKQINSVFPAHTAYQRLSALREALANYLFTEADAKDLLLWAFERWLIFVATNSPEKFASYQDVFKEAQGANRLFSRDFLKQLDFPMFNLRVPVAVGPESYSFLPNYHTASPKPPGPDRRRIDHDSKP
jgi:hypothetical protein